MTYFVPHYINGKTELISSEKKQAIYNPALGEVIGQTYFADARLVNDTVEKANLAFLSWSKTPTVKRAKILFKFRDLLEDNLADLAKIVNQEHGKTIDDAKGSIYRAIELVEYHCGLISQLQSPFSAELSSGIDSYTLRQPLGVCAGVSPFNFPVMVPMWMIIPAIACGNSFVLKPSEQDPSAPIRLLELLTEAGLPDGVANCLQGNKETVGLLLSHPDVRTITAVASTPVAKSIYETAIANGKRSHTFGGAKNHALIMPDANFEQAANAIVGAAFGSAGERCMAISVVVSVGEQTEKELLSHLIPMIKKIRVDVGDKPDADMGPLISSVHKDKVIAAINQGVKEGANLLIDGRPFKHPDHPQGFFVGPSLFTEVDESMTIYQDEIFGPVLVMLKVNSLKEGIDLINRHQYGNGTAIFTRDGYSAREFSQEIDVGMVGINIPIPVPIVNHPFGGWKNSSFGNTNMHGLESIDFYTRRKTITSKWPSSNLKSSAFVMPTNH
ncbi:MAG: CoA-acylating methylmalonate-semialdehyde dehydrogenase [Proteobacteria bacterium]|nr:CoA-acylating methylmalonate-semialdehyde dehydrogenase [Pseudomonadota bacterium]